MNVCVVCEFWVYGMAQSVCVRYHVSTIWSPLASDTNINKLQVTQNTALRIATGCTPDTNTQHLHDETHTLPIKEHLQLHASQIRQKLQHPTHPLHYITTQQTTPRPPIFQRRGGADSESEICVFGKLSPVGFLVVCECSSVLLQCVVMSYVDCGDDE